MTCTVTREWVVNRHQWCITFGCHEPGQPEWFNLMVADTLEELIDVAFDWIDAGAKALSWSSQ